MSRVEVIISDFGGVLTTPLLDGFLAVQEASGLSLEELGRGLAGAAERLGENPLFELERGRLSEARFTALLEQALTEQLGREVSMRDFSEHFFSGLRPNERMIDYLRELRERGLRLALCTNNVREWEPRWRPTLPVEEMFEVVVDSAFVGVRKPDPQIYEITLQRLGVEAGAALLVDDTDINCDAARELGLQAVWFHDSEQAVGDIEAALTGA